MFNQFWRNTLTEKHRPDDPLNTDPLRTTPLAPSGKRFKCVFCDCVMTGDGQDIWSMGERAKEFDSMKVKHADVIEKKDKEIARLSEELANAKKEIERLTPASGETRASGYRAGKRVA